MKTTLLILFGLTASLMAISQDEEEAVLEIAKQLFVAMETNDGDLAASLFTEGAQLSTVHKDKEGITRVSSILVEKLVEVFSKEKEQTYSEPIWNERIMIDGDYAVVWVDYAFYIGNSFSHCGVDMFQMVKLEAGWKIFGLTDTRRKSDCTVPEEISATYTK